MVSAKAGWILFFGFRHFERYVNIFSSFFFSSFKEKISVRAIKEWMLKHLAFIWAAGMLVAGLLLKGRLLIIVAKHIESDMRDVFFTIDSEA